MRRAPAQGIHGDSSGDSQIGRARRINQDQFFITPLGEPDGIHCLFGVADGIGGGPGGEEASFIAVETLTGFVKEESDRLLHAEGDDGRILETLTRGLKRCHSELQRLVGEQPEYSGMGTTLTAGLVLWPHLYLVHMGDARAYLLRDGELRRLTRDHTYAQALLEAGVLNEVTVQTSSMRHVVSNFIGGEIPEKDSEVHPDVRVDVLQPGDTLVLCTDGLTNAVPDETILVTLSQDGSSSDLCRNLLDLARQREAKDDATVVVARFAEAGAPPGGRRRSR